MSPTPALKDARAAFDALKQACKSSRAKATKQSLVDLASCIALLGISQPSEVAIQKINSLLKPALDHLYSVSLTRALDVCAVAITAILDHKIVKGSENVQTRLTQSWLDIQNPLVSGALDFLEQKPQNATKVAIASSLYPTLCTRLFPGGPASAKDASQELLYLVYILLSDSASAHAENQRKLRERLTAGRIGRTLSGTKGFIALESLLDLFATILPPGHSKGVTKRTEFVNEVFHATYFSCYEQLRQAVQNASSSKWTDTSEKIVRILAESDVKYPQPIRVTTFTVCGNEIPDLEDIYLDDQKLLYSVEKGDEVETLAIPFATIRAVNLQPEDPPSFSFVLDALPQPALKASGSKTPGSGSSFSAVVGINPKDLSRFMSALKARGVAATAQQTGRKLSKANEPITLDFDANGKSYKEKANTVYQDMGPTSPASASTKYDSRPNSSAKGQEHRSEEEIPQLPASEGFDNSPELPTKVPRKRADKKYIVTSDDEEDAEIPLRVEVSKSAPKTPLKDITNSNAKSTRPPPPENKKRKAVEADEPPSKRTRASSPTTKVDKSRVLRDPVKAARRYGKKARSSPPPEVDDFDQISSPAVHRPRPEPNDFDHVSSPPPRVEVLPWEKDTDAKKSKGRSTKSHVEQNDDEINSKKAKGTASTRKTAQNENKENKRTKTPAPPVREKPKPRPVTKPKATAKNDNTPTKAKQSKPAATAARKPQKTRTKPMEDEPEQPSDAESALTELPDDILEMPTSGIDLSDRPPVQEFSEPQHDLGDLLKTTTKSSSSPEGISGPPVEPVTLSPEAAQPSRTVAAIDLTQESPPKPKPIPKLVIPAAKTSMKPSVPPRVAETATLARSAQAPNRVVSAAGSAQAMPGKELGARQTRSPSVVLLEKAPALIAPRHHLSSVDALETLPMLERPAAPLKQAIAFDRTTDLSSDTLAQVSTVMSPTARLAPDLSAKRPSAASSSRDLRFGGYHAFPEPQPADHTKHTATSMIPHSIERPSVALRETPLPDRVRYTENGFYDSGWNDTRASRDRFGNVVTSEQQFYDSPRSMYRRDRVPSFDVPPPPPKTSRIRGDNRMTGETKDHTQEIVKIMAQIQGVIVNRISGKFKNVKTGLRRGNVQLLGKAGEAVENMAVESVDHFNSMVALESEYAACHRGVSSGIDDVFRTEDETRRTLGEIVKAHDRNSLSKKFPKKLTIQRVNNPRAVL